MRISWKIIPAPILLLITALLTFGLQIPWLGYYLDDWIILAANNSGGAIRLFEYVFIGNRPLVFWIWWLGFELVGEAPLGWHIWTLFWRWLTVVAAWIFLRELWSENKHRALWVAALFLVYPLFMQQPTALTFNFHWVCFCLFFISLYAMLRAARSPRHYFLWSVLAILTNAVQLFSQEFYVGLEIIRPLVLFFAFQEGKEDVRQRMLRPIRHWIPYLLLFAGYMIWRFGFMPTPGVDRNAPTVLLDLLSQPLATIPALLSRILQDLAVAFFGVWARAVHTETLTLQPISNWVAWALALAVFAICLVFLRKHDSVPEVESKKWRTQAFLLGVAALLGGFGPGWVIGQHITNAGLYNDRFGLAAMFGLAILVVLAIDWLVRAGRLQALILCVLLGLAAGQHFRSTTVYRWSWEQQQRLFWQLKWRVPDLHPYTAIFGNGALVQFIGSWANVSAVNLIYSEREIPAYAYYWYFDVYRYHLANVAETSDTIVDVKNFLRYDAPPAQGIVLADVEEPISCLWVVSEADRHNPYLEEALREVLPLSDFSRVITDSDKPMPGWIFGKEIRRDWCYYYQKARLAEQQSDWETVMRLWEEATGAGYRTLSEPEYVPFILAAAHTGRWETALTLTDKAYFPDYVMRDYLCTTWRRIRDEVPESPERQQALETAVSQFDCQSIFTP